MKKREGGDIQWEQRKREEKNDKGRYFRSCKKKIIIIKIY